jgi:hypothetical protein
VSRMSLTAPKTSPTLADSPTSPRISEASPHDIGSPSSRAETLSIRKKSFTFDGTTKGESRSTGLHGIAEETSSLITDDIAAKLSSGGAAGSISKRRGYRPLSVRIGEAFNPFSARESKSDAVEVTQNPTDLDEDHTRDLQTCLELSKKVNWSENVDPHLFNANFVATLTSKRKRSCTPG